MEQVYEIANIEKSGDLTEKETSRIGKRVVIHRLTVGASAILPFVDEDDKALFTSTVDCTLGKNGDKEVIFTTRNSIYTLRKVAD
jgi:hypothetical protein